MMAKTFSDVRASNNVNPIIISSDYLNRES